MIELLSSYDRNLLVFLRNCTPLACQRWTFLTISFHEFIGKIWRAPDCFSGQIIRYERRNSFVCLFSFWLLKLRYRGHVQRVYFISDGLLSYYVNADQIDCYHCFVARHVAPKNTRLARFKHKIPLFLRSQYRYLILSSTEALLPVQQPIADFMFLSNQDGKLLLLNKETLHSGQGAIYKTTASLDYRKVIEHEFSLMKLLGNKSVMVSLLPRAIEYLQTGEDELFAEEYLHGMTLRDTLSSAPVSHNTQQCIACFDQLDDWYRTYRKGFAGEKQSFTELLTWIFPVYQSAYGSDAVSDAVITGLKRRLAECDDRYPGLVPVISHSDLWPGNFILSARGLVAIDWERAVSDRAELFDYFWMMVSAGIEVLVSRHHLPGYAVAFEMFLNKEDEVSEMVTEQLYQYLAEINVEPGDFCLFFTLFLMELSVQGYTVYGEPTDMDKLVHDQLVRYIHTIDYSCVTTSMDQTHV